MSGDGPVEPTQNPASANITGNAVPGTALIAIIETTVALSARPAAGTRPRLVARGGAGRRAGGGAEVVPGGTLGDEASGKDARRRANHVRRERAGCERRGD